MTGIYKPKPPKERNQYRYRGARPKKPSSRYELILNGAVRKYPDGREVCQNNAAGKREYSARVRAMVQRQGYKCCLSEVIPDCPVSLSVLEATFEHTDLRGLGGATRDDRIVDEFGNEMNGAAHWICNSQKGSRREMRGEKQA